METIQPGTRVLTKFGFGTVRQIDQDSRRAEVRLDESIRGDGDYSYWASLKNLSLESEWPSSAKEGLLIFCGAVAALVGLVGLLLLLDSNLFQGWGFGTGEGQMTILEFLVGISILPVMLFVFCRD
ncbi:hypothetical protein [Stutzerimonas decontaminans]|uniref:Uncharacterized protein n=1 Tax=Stutzerimonas stutzeri TaxID=316 RepID=A0A023WYE5_STUST|nr:hypothetical protein [Stutzerimonas decontaminans]AHY45252.1 hypothetical protein UIB01_22435 [Stutzerimonas decontaminans]